MEDIPGMPVNVLLDESLKELLKITEKTLCFQRNTRRFFPRGITERIPSIISGRIAEGIPVETESLINTGLKIIRPEVENTYTNRCCIKF